MNEVSGQAEGNELTEFEDSNSEVTASQQPSDEQTLIQARNVSVVFDDQIVLQNIELQITRGQTVAIIGESGCGKTTTIGMLLGLLKPSKGQINKMKVV